VDLMPWLPSGIIILLLVYTLRRWLLHWDALEAERDARAAGSFPKPAPPRYGDWHAGMMAHDEVYAEIDRAATARRQAGQIPGTLEYWCKAHAEMRVNTPPWARDVPARDQEPSRMAG
jgi:hypothetical protein